MTKYYRNLILQEYDKLINEAGYERVIISIEKDLELISLKVFFNLEEAREELDNILTFDTQITFQRFIPDDRGSGEAFQVSDKTLNKETLIYFDFIEFEE